MPFDVSDRGSKPKDFGLGHSAFDEIFLKIQEGGFPLSRQGIHDGVPYQTDGYIVEQGPNGSVHIAYFVDKPLTPELEQWGKAQTKKIIKYLRTQGIILDYEFE